MVFDPDRFHRRSVRLQSYDYSGVGVYFVTICAHERRLIFGREQAQTIRLHPYGEIVAQQWLLTEQMRHRVTLDEWVVMPNHFHALLWFTEPAVIVSTSPRGTLWRAPDSLGSLMGGWKSKVTSQIWQHREERGLNMPRIWQKNYHEHIVRDERELELIRRYIREHPLNWQSDSERNG